jgi:xylulokinase
VTDGGGQLVHGTSYVGIDIGTSGCKAVLLSDAGAVLHTAWEGYAAYRGTDGEVSQDAGDWDRAAAATLAGCGAAAGEAGLDVGGICCTGVAHTMVLLDERDEPLDRAILPFDRRSADAAARMLERFGPALFDRTFVQLGPSWTLPQLAWLRGRSPAMWPRIRRALVTKDYLTYRLTGRAATDPSDAAGTAMFDQLTGDWADDLLLEAGLSRDRVAPVLPATAVAGGLTAEWAAIMGIPAGTPVAVGATDTAAELVSLGATEPGSGLVKIASTGTVVAVLDRPHPNPVVLTYPCAIPARWYQMTATNTAATAYAWLRETVFAATRGEPAATYGEMDEFASGVPPGSEGVLFLPFLEGERSPYWDPDLRAAFLGVSSAHQRSHLARAVLEGVALSIRDCRDQLSGLGISVARPVFTGGGATSRLWRTILASVLDTPGSLATPQGPAVGAAQIAAAAASGQDLIERLAAARPTLEPVEPEARWVPIYDHVYATYREAARGLADISHQMVRTAREAALLP